MIEAINKNHHITVSFTTRNGEPIAKASAPWDSEWFVENHEHDIAKQSDLLISGALMTLVTEGYYDLAMRIHSFLMTTAMSVEITVLNKFYGETPKSDYPKIVVTTTGA